jgi:hypothetical protein
MYKTIEVICAYSLEIGFKGVIASKKITLALYKIGHIKVFVFLKRMQRNMLSAKADSTIRSVNIKPYALTEAGTIHIVNMMEVMSVA